LEHLQNLYQGAQMEIQDLQNEFEDDRQGYLSTIRELFQELSLYKQITHTILPMGEIERLTTVSTWNNETEEWTIPEIHIPRSNAIPPSLRKKEGGGSSSLRSRRTRGLTRLKMTSSSSVSNSVPSSRVSTPAALSPMDQGGSLPSSPQTERRQSRGRPTSTESDSSNNRRDSYDPLLHSNVVLRNRGIINQMGPSSLGSPGSDDNTTHRDQRPFRIPEPPVSRPRFQPQSLPSPDSDLSSSGDHSLSQHQSYSIPEPKSFRPRFQPQQLGSPRSDGDSGNEYDGGSGRSTTVSPALSFNITRPKFDPSSSGLSSPSSPLPTSNFTSSKADPLNFEITRPRFNPT